MQCIAVRDALAPCLPYALLGGRCCCPLPSLTFDRGASTLSLLLAGHASCTCVWLAAMRRLARACCRLPTLLLLWRQAASLSDPATPRRSPPSTPPTMQAALVRAHHRCTCVCVCARNTVIDKTDSEARCDAWAHPKIQHSGGARTTDVTPPWRRVGVGSAEPRRRQTAPSLGRVAETRPNQWPRTVPLRRQTVDSASHEAALPLCRIRLQKARTARVCLARLSKRNVNQSHRLRNDTAPLALSDVDDREYGLLFSSAPLQRDGTDILMKDKVPSGKRPGVSGGSVLFTSGWRHQGSRNKKGVMI